MHIRVSDKELGECNVEINSKIDKRAEYLIKSLCVMQIMCMNSDEQSDKFEDFIQIIKEATEKAQQLYCDEEINEQELNGTEDFHV